ncbi:histidine kinase [Novosphingobium album (ex Hu et al. 2023)]|uniref:Histidine kinase n=1 Tax=Novosphingobium album (ex Hu et al. 2023) TaxID=2930093 RepID=A0ABT0AXI6_9SPHN|nr:histidine kinase [Novosphingobium album (ex Hu et al. 2023)]MCJ2177485.1 histidine kinase [Novosphingobium album (ex Hu et al. 2023)]
MRRKSVPIKALLVRTFLPAVVVVSVLLAGLVYNRLYASILNGFERKLVAASAMTGAMIDPDDHDRLIAAARSDKDTATTEASPLYQRNVRPIRHIRDELGLTYLYTQVLGGPGDIQYILDGTEGADHSPLGSGDDLPGATVAGLKRVQARGAVYVSPIEYQEQWGLLKTAASPVMGANGQITGSTGADVNISVIQVATQNALFQSAMIGIGSVLVCLLVALALVRRIAVPIEALTEYTLQIAGGHTPVSGISSGPREVKALRSHLDMLTGAMARSAQQREQEEERAEEMARAAILSAQTHGKADEPVILIEEENRLVAWISGEPLIPQGVLAARAMANLGQICIVKPDIRAIWRDLADLDHGKCIVIDAIAGTIECLGTSGCEVDVDGKTRSIAPNSRMGLAPHETVTLIRPDRSGFLLWPRGGR